MTRLILAATIAMLTLPAAMCQTAQVHDACDTSIRAASTATDFIGLLVRDWHLSPEKAAQWAADIAKSQDAIRLFCAAIPPAPLAVVGG